MYFETNPRSRCRSDSGRSVQLLLATTLSLFAFAAFAAPDSEALDSQGLAPGAMEGLANVMADPGVLDILGFLPLSGEINVGDGQAFNSLTNSGGLFEAANAAGLAGDTVINITSDLLAETGAIALDQFSEIGPGGYTLTIRPSGAPRLVSGASAVSNGLIVLNGADRVIFDGSLDGEDDRSLTFSNGQVSTSTVFWIKSGGGGNGAHDIVIRNCIITGTRQGNAQTTAGILAGGNTVGGAAESPNSNNTIERNLIYGVQNSFFSQGAVSPNFDVNWQILNNEFGSANAKDRNLFRGMLIGNARDFIISGNLIRGIYSSTTTSAAMSGIQVAFQVDGGLVAANRIHDIRSQSPTGTGAFGIQITPTSTTSNLSIINNFVHDVAALGSAAIANNAHGFSIFSGGGFVIQHNSINMAAGQGAGTTSAIRVGPNLTAGAIEMRNNILANTPTSSAVRYAIYSQSPASVFNSIDFNDYFAADNVGFLDNTHESLANWQVATGQDLDSLSIDPMFVSASDLHLLADSPMINAGTPLAGVDFDIDGDLRSPTTPDVGADEFLTEQIFFDRFQSNPLRMLQSTTSR